MEKVDKALHVACSIKNNIWKFFGISDFELSVFNGLFFCNLRTQRVIEWLNKIFNWSRITILLLSSTSF